MLTKDDIIKMMNRDKKDYEAELAAWQKVTFNTKKDGTPFQNLKKCFNNANYGFSSYDSNHESPSLAVYYQANGYQARSINCYEYSYGKPNRPFTFEEIKAAITDRIAKLKSEIAQIEADLKKVDTFVTEIDKAIDEFVSVVNEQIKDRQSYYSYRRATEKYLAENLNGKIDSIYLTTR